MTNEIQPGVLYSGRGMSSGSYAIPIACDDEQVTVYLYSQLAVSTKSMPKTVFDGDFCPLHGPQVTEVKAQFGAQLDTQITMLSGARTALQNAPTLD